MHKMKTLLTITLAALALAFTTAAQAQLTPKEFERTKTWAGKIGFFYEGTTKSAGVKVYLFTNGISPPQAEGFIYALVPCDSDSADEAINALIASSLTYQEMWASGRDAAQTAYAEGYANGSNER